MGTIANPIISVHSIQFCSPSSNQMSQLLTINSDFLRRRPRSVKSDFSSREAIKYTVQYYFGCHQLMVQWNLLLYFNKLVVHSISQNILNVKKNSKTAKFLPEDHITPSGFVPDSQPLQHIKQHKSLSKYIQEHFINKLE